ncbi:uncharacterized protein LOC129926883 [Biomphalaria glabrata]|uniref:Uncharacterized protein LOC129926883 n=1 Tax=Biomphalaria glabrata TaxID=6526 RepID=A0A9W3AQ35_BIOGL|nr:uncharacterized protein LOC129926883 [Biomphalaria glabrata]
MPPKKSKPQFYIEEGGVNLQINIRTGLNDYEGETTETCSSSSSSCHEDKVCQKGERYRIKRNANAQPEKEEVKVQAPVENEQRPQVKAQAPVENEQRPDSGVLTGYFVASMSSDAGGISSEKGPAVEQVVNTAKPATNLKK